CKSVFYCSKECQKREWKNHKDECKVLVSTNLYGTKPLLDDIVTFFKHLSAALIACDKKQTGIVVNTLTLDEGFTVLSKLFYASKAKLPASYLNCETNIVLLIFILDTGKKQVVEKRLVEKELSAMQDALTILDGKLDHFYESKSILSGKITLFSSVSHVTADMVSVVPFEEELYTLLA